MLDKFFVYLVLAIIILFQEDIRRGLARAGDFLPNFQATQDVAIEDVIRTTYSLAARRIGALIAIVVLVVLIFFIVRRKKSQNKYDCDKNDQSENKKLNEEEA